jgi:4-carboxymuconolactone decarboxylase
MMNRRKALGGLALSALATSSLASASSSAAAQKAAAPAAADRYAIGLERLQAVTGQDGSTIVQSLARISPDFARYVVEFIFGDIYTRPVLDLRSREIATIAALTALGTASPQLGLHVAAGRHVGLSQAEIIEIIMQMAAYAGFPAAINGLTTAQTVFAAEAAAPGASVNPVANDRKE